MVLVLFLCLKLSFLFQTKTSFSATVSIGVLLDATVSFIVAATASVFVYAIAFGNHREQRSKQQIENDER